MKFFLRSADSYFASSDKRPVGAVSTRRLPILPRLNLNLPHSNAKGLIPNGISAPKHRLHTGSKGARSSLARRLILVGAPHRGEISMTDLELKKEVEAELNFEPSRDAAAIGLAVKDGIVTLTGHVDSYWAKIAAERAASRVAGVKAVANDLDVRLPTSSERTDEDIARAVINALNWSGSCRSHQGHRFQGLADAGRPRGLGVPKTRRGKGCQRLGRR